PDEIRGWIERVSRRWIVEAARGSRGTENEVVTGSVSGQRGLRIFDGERKPHLVVEILGDAEAKLACPTEPDRVLRVDGHGQRFRAVVHALLGFCDQAPHLAASKAPAVNCSLSPRLSLAEAVAVALVVVGS